MTYFVDIHSHIIPGIDDGAHGARTAKEMLILAAEGGTNHIVATPHYISGEINNTPAIIEEGCGSLSQIVSESFLNLDIYPGSEVFISPDIPDLYDKGLITCINKSRYILVEFPQLQVPQYTNEVLYQLQLRGLVPIIAHPERYEAVRRSPGLIREMAGRGILTQINSVSLTGLYGTDIKKTAKKLIDNGIAHFVASDAHSCGERNPDMGKAYDYVTRKWGSDAADRLFRRNGLAVINNKEI
jgi:protein-tyrosine phosphatase